MIEKLMKIKVKILDKSIFDEVRIFLEKNGDDFYQNFLMPEIMYVDLSLDSYTHLVRTYTDDSLNIEFEHTYDQM